MGTRIGRGYTYRSSRGRQFAFDEASMADRGRRMRPTVIESLSGGVFKHYLPME